MKIYVFPADMYGCGHYRLIWPAEALRAQGHDVTIVFPKQRTAALRGVLHGDKLVDVQVPNDADVIVLQRVTHRHIVSAIEILRKRGIAVVIDIDDDLSCIHPHNPAFLSMHPSLGQPDHSWHNAQLACDLASYVTVSSDALFKKYVRHGRGMILHNFVPKRYLDVERVDTNTIGWGGAVFSHPDDLPVVGNAINQLTRDGVSFWVVGPEAGVKEALHLDNQPKSTGVVDLEAWPHTLAKLGVGIAPLADSKFNAAKSWLKMLEYAALGVPCVASPRAEYVKLHKKGIGLLADKPRDWLRHLRRLTENANLRDEMSRRGREIAREMTIEGNAWRWLEAWTAAYQVERQERSVLVR